MKNSNQEIILFILLWIIYWLAVQGGLIIFLKPIGIDHNNNSHFTVMYFLLSAIFGVLFFCRDLFFSLSLNNSLLYISSTFLFISTSVLIEILRDTTLEVFNLVNEIGVFYLLLTPSSIFSKAGDVIFQQILILCLVTQLHKKQLANRMIIMLVGISFFCHTFTPLFLFRKLVMALYFTLYNRWRDFFLAHITF